MGIYAEKRDKLVARIEELTKRIATDTAKKQDVEEESYHRHIENQLMLLGWEPWKGELYTEKTFLIAFVRIS